MADAFSEFRWPVAMDYRCIETAEDVPDSWRTPVDLHPWEGSGTKVHVIAAVGPTAKTIQPFSRDLVFLYREFAELQVTPETAVAFARRYGLLGDTGVDPIHPLEIDIPLPDGMPLRGEVLNARKTDSWQRRATLLKHAVHLDDKIRITRPGKFADWANGRPEAWRTLCARYASALNGRRDAVEAARAVLQAVLDEHLAQSVGPRVVWSDAEERFRMSYTPRTLLGAMWLQFATRVAGEQPVHQCKKCDKSFEVSKEPTGSRTRADAEFCSGKCKSADYRDRKKQVLAMRDSGMRPAAIAASSSTNITTVRRWISGARVTKRGRTLTSVAKEG